MKKRKRVAKELSRLQTQLETAERREHWDTVLMLDREIDRIGLDVACTNDVHNYVMQQQGACSHCGLKLNLTSEPERGKLKGTHNNAAFE